MQERDLQDVRRREEGIKQKEREAQSKGRSKMPRRTDISEAARARIQKERRSASSQGGK